MGALSRIESSRGEKIYKYNALGQLITQIEKSTTGDETDKKIEFHYNTKGRLTSKKGISNGKEYTYTIKYDPQGRVISSEQNTPEATFNHRNIVYDGIGRVSSYEKEVRSSGIVTKASIENLYSTWNGEMYQVKDKVSGKSLWELKETNARSQVIKAKLGTTEVNNAYNGATGMIQEIKHINNQGFDLINMQYTFNAIKNELNVRKNLVFNINESFDYDDNNRLVNWTNPVTGIKPSANRNLYDIKGRIIKNDQVGTINYQDNERIYQPTGMTLNTAGIANYNSDLIQHILYNENNDPVKIDGEKGDVAFQYGLTAMRQRVAYGGNFGPEGGGKFIKIYSEEGSFEVVKNNYTGKEKHIIYIGASPYEADVVYLKDFEATSGSYCFIHKDYLGSVLAISNETGKILERRHYDAWGNFTHLQIGFQPVITEKYLIDEYQLVLDRGYTGHEYFPEVGIIHMNGRLYDPLLRRFLSADENIQDPFNTQNYNRYGYVLNNPLMYTDPSGEIVWMIAIGAVAGAYFTGVKANGSYNPLDWNWGATWGKIVMGGAIGAFTGGVATVVGASALAYAATSWGIQGGVLGGAIAGASGGAVAGAISGFATSVMFGENILKGTFMGGLYGGALGGAMGAVFGGAQQGIANYKAAKVGDPQGTILKGAPVAEGRSPWTLNNTPKVPKTTTLGPTPPAVPKQGKLEVGDAVEEKIIGYATREGTDILEPVTIKPGEYSEELIKAAQRIYPNKAGKIEMHHIEPQYIGGPKNGKLVPLDAAYHQVITNEFRNLHPYGIGPIDNPLIRAEIMRQVYSQLPLPPGYSY